VSPGFGSFKAAVDDGGASSPEELVVVVGGRSVKSAATWFSRAPKTSWSSFSVNVYS